MKNKLLLLVCLLGLLAGGAGATVSLSVEQLSVFAQATATDLNRGYLEYPATRLTIIGDEPWSLSIRAQNDTFSSTGGAVKPTANLLWKRGGSFQELGTVDAPLAAGSAGTTNVDLVYRLKLTWLDPPDSYAATVVYTLTAQGD